MHIAILYTLPTRRAADSSYVDADTDTEDSAKEVALALQSKGHRTTLYPITEDTIAIISTITGDLIFNLAEWTGRDMSLIPLVFDQLDARGIPYTGATKDNYIVTADKVQMKQRLDTYGLPSALWQAFGTGEEAVRGDFVYPVIIKPALEHCSIGLSRESIAHTAPELTLKVQKQIAAFAESMVVEEFIAGQEFQVTVLESDGIPWVLPPAEITFDTTGADAFLSFAGRWDESSSEYAKSHTKIATLPKDVQKDMERICRETFIAFGFRDYARFDMRLRGTEFYILEPNSNPGLGESDDYGMTLSHRAVGMTFADLLEKIVASCLRRYPTS